MLNSLQKNVLQLKQITSFRLVEIKNFANSLRDILETELNPYLYNLQTSLSNIYNDLKQMFVN